MMFAARVTVKRASKACRADSEAGFAYEHLRPVTTSSER
jgi:hypothetical protein